MTARRAPRAAALPSIELNDGHRMPAVGLGVYRIADDEADRVVGAALDAGYRSVDTAAMYGNEASVGAALTRSDVARDELFVTTKLDNASHGYDATRAAFDRSLARLGMDYVDLYLIHWPQPHLDRFVETWRALIALRADGLARSIGVSNFQAEHLERIIGDTAVVPAVNQIESHPLLVQDALRARHRELGIATEAWSPIARGRLLSEPVLTDIAAAHDRTPAQVVLRWHVQLGTIVIPKSATPARIVENIDLADFILTDQEMAEIATLDRHHRTGPDPDTFPLRRN